MLVLAHHHLISTQVSISIDLLYESMIAKVSFGVVIDGDQNEDEKVRSGNKVQTTVWRKRRAL